MSHNSDLTHPECSKLILNTQNIALWTIILIGGTAILVVGKSLLIPIVLSVFLAILLSSFREAIRRQSLFGLSLNRTLASLVAAVFVLAGSFFAFSLLNSQVALMSEHAALYQANLEQIGAQVSRYLGIESGLGYHSISEYLDLGLIISATGETLSDVFSNVVLTLMFTLFLFAEEHKVKEKLPRMLGNVNKAREVQKASASIAASIQTYVTAKSVLSAVTGFATYVILQFTDVHFAPLWGALAFLLNFIPNVGSFIAVLLPALFSLLQFGVIAPVLLLVGSLGSMQFFIGSIIEPSYLGKQLNLSPFLVLVSLTLWGAVWGLVGMFLAVPLMVLTSLICQHIKGFEWLSRLLSSDGQFMAIRQTA